MSNNGKKGPLPMIISMIVVAAAVITVGAVLIFNMNRNASDKGSEETTLTTDAEQREGGDDQASLAEYRDGLMSSLYNEFIRLHPSSTPTPTPTATPTPSATPTPTATPTPSPVPDNIDDAIRDNIDRNIEAIKTDDEAEDAAEDLIEDVLGLKSRYWSSYLDPEDCAEVFMESVEYDVTLDYSKIEEGVVTATVDISRRDYREALAATLRYYMGEMGYDTDASEDIWGSINPGITTLYELIDYGSSNITWRSFMDLYNGYLDDTETFSDSFDIEYDVTLDESTGAIQSIVLSDVRSFDGIREFVWEQ